MFTDLGLYLVGSLIICVRLRASNLDCRMAGMSSMSQFKSPSSTSSEDRLGAISSHMELIAPHLSSEFVLLDYLNWDMLNTPAVLQSKLDALNLTQIIKEPTRYNPKFVNIGTLLDIILTN